VGARLIVVEKPAGDLGAEAKKSEDEIRKGVR
jgi:hypothetical protein